jgi:tetratricopeptide (TPR) repeat protein
MLAVDPLTPIPHRYLAEAAEQLGEPNDAIAAYRALLEFDTVDHVNAHFRLATVLRDKGRTNEARRHVLLALEDAPRFSAAHRLLLELTESARDDAEIEPQPEGGDAPAAAPDGAEDP